MTTPPHTHNWQFWKEENRPNKRYRSESHDKFLFFIGPEERGNYYDQFTMFTCHCGAAKRVPVKWEEPSQPNP